MWCFFDKTVLRWTVILLRFPHGVGLHACCSYGFRFHLVFRSAMRDVSTSVRTNANKKYAPCFIFIIVLVVWNTVLNNQNSGCCGIRKCYAIISVSEMPKEKCGWVDGAKWRYACVCMRMMRVCTGSMGLCASACQQQTSPYGWLWHWFCRRAFSVLSWFSGSG